jgi:hypothetical protein
MEGDSQDDLVRKGDETVEEVGVDQRGGATII